MTASLAGSGDRVIRHLAYDGEAGQWEMLRTHPHQALKSYVIDYSGYRETQGSEIWRRELPCSFVPLIINFGPAFHFRDDPRSPATQTSFTAGVYTRAVIVGSRGAAFCVQVNFTPFGAWRFFRLSQSELESRTVSLDDLLGAQGRSLIAELHDAPGWPERFALLDDFIARRILAAREPDANVREVWRALTASHGTASIVALARTSGISRRHLAKLFRAEIGATPKTMARILRFEHARDLAHKVPRLGWADLAYAAGYADQAHLAREFKDLSGLTPQELLRRDRAETGILEQ
ncbi:AraC family transcriptional regulator [Nordella sp. HKS 07]|uniref:helix-turn-helix domain-containing protein n=1 Tax=Nordella sp. HKS 07 TaxID=2712222 RepID=UPI0013E187A0|nr:helix-turn-helix domain-containing protein [Nordella sp. HKS 07]QIG46351.1 AraC family transcriptional regulator [Nordella sp. HKS 07]